MLEVESMQDMLLLPPRKTNECKTKKTGWKTFALPFGLAHVWGDHLFIFRGCKSYFPLNPGC